MLAIRTRQQNRKRQGNNHEDYCAPRRQPCKQVGRSTRPESCLRTLAAKSTREVSGLALLQQHNSDKEEADDDVNNDEKDDHDFGKILQTERKFEVPVLTSSKPAFSLPPAPLTSKAASGLQIAAVAGLVLNAPAISIDRIWITCAVALSEPSDCTAYATNSRATSPAFLFCDAMRAMSSG